MEYLTQEQLEQEIAWQQEIANQINESNYDYYFKKAQDGCDVSAAKIEHFENYAY
jgi:hypothetical protein